MSATTNRARSRFTPDEVAYLQTQRLGRSATVSPSGEPHVVPVAFRFNPDTYSIDVGGHGFVGRKKWRDVQGNPKVAIVIDDIASLNPWKVRGVEVRGEAALLATGGQTINPGFDAEMFWIRPTRVVSWGINPDTAPA